MSISCLQRATLRFCFRIGLGAMSYIFLTQNAAAAKFDLFWPSSSVQGSGVVRREVREIGPFSALDLVSSARIELQQGNAESVTIVADDNVLPLIDVHLKGKTLVVRDGRRYHSSIASIVITLRRVAAISTGGSTAVTSDALIAPALDLSVGGSSALQLKALTAETLAADVGGSAALKVSGLVNAVKLNVGGSCVIDLGKLVAKTVVFNGGGSAQAIVRADDALTVSVGGSANLTYYGQPATTVSRGGSATVRQARH